MNMKLSSDVPLAYEVRRSSRWIGRSNGRVRRQSSGLDECLDESLLYRRMNINALREAVVLAAVFCALGALGTTTSVSAWFVVLDFILGFLCTAAVVLCAYRATFWNSRVGRARSDK
jgi:heme A synthase